MRCHSGVFPPHALNYPLPDELAGSEIVLIGDDHVIAFLQTFKHLGKSSVRYPTLTVRFSTTPFFTCQT